MKTLSSCFLLLMFLELGVFAQNKHELAHKFTPLSPAASSLYKSVNFPVSYATGKTDVTIPLYEIREGNLVLPISISYSSSGLKVSDPAGLIGMGWSLKAEPLVSRQAKGIADDDGRGYLNNASLNTVTTPEYLHAFAKGDWDEDPDDFYFSTLNRSGQFFFKRKSLTSPSLGYDIVNNPLSPVIINKISNGFSIKESDGTTYTYDKFETTNVPGSYSYQSAWKISGISSATTGDQINFNYYDNVSQEHYFSYTNSITIEEFPGSPLDCIDENQLTNLCERSDYDLPGPVIRRNYQGNRTLSHFFSGVLEDICSTNGSSNSLNQTVITTKKLKEILFDQGKVGFEYWERAGNYSISGAALPSVNSFMLNTISVYSKTANGYALLKKIKFYQDISHWNRETLDSIKVFDAQNIPVETYRFSYNETGMPEYPYPFSDHWGYTNTYSSPGGSDKTGVMYGNLVSIPFNICLFHPYDFDTQVPIGSPVTVNIGDTEKAGNFDGAIAKMLERIDYPTGGFTTFTYESNKFKTLDDEEVTGGGLRIKEIKNYASQGSIPTVRSFKYGEGESGFGLGHKVTIDDYVYNKSLTYQIPNTWDEKRTSSKRTFMINPVNSYFFPEGAPVVYPYVNEYNGTLTENQGRISYRYNYTPDYLFYTRERISPTSLLMKDFRNHYLWGELLEKKTFENKLGYQLIRKENFGYEEVLGGPIGYSRKIYCTADMADGAYRPGSNYEQYYAFDVTLDGFAPAVKNKILERTVDYSNGDSIVNVKKMAYDPLNSHFPRKITSINSKGDSTSVTNFYPTDLLQPVHTTMKALNVIDPVVEDVTKKDDAIELSKFRINYVQDLSGLILKSDVERSYSGNPLTKEVTYHKYDNRGNILSVSKEPGAKTCYIWAYNGQYPVAEISNAEYSAIETILGASNISVFSGTYPDKTAVDSFIAPLKTALPNAQITSFSFVPLIGMVSQTDAKGMTIYYEYDTFQRLKHIKDQNGNIIKSYDYHYKP